MSIPWTHVIALVLHVFAPDHPQGSPALLNWAADDEKRVAALAATGRRMEGSQVIVWAPPSMTDDEQRGLLERLDRGVRELRLLIGSHEWQSVGAQKITYYIAEDQFVAHGTGRAAVFVPLSRVEDGRAPYLHEAMHELLATPPTRGAVEAERVARTKLRPLWLSEGLPDYVAQTVAGRIGFTEGDVFDTGGLSGVHKTCATRLRGPAGETVLPFIGGPGRPEALFTTERQTVAPTFYACAFSFTTYLVDRIGLAETIALIPLIPSNSVHERIETLLGKSMSEVRVEWRRLIDAAR